MVFLNEQVERLLLIGLFMVCIFSFAIGIGSNYGRTSSQMTSSAIDTHSIETKINSTNTAASGWLTAIQGDNPIVYVAIVTIKSVWGIAKAIITLIPSLFALYLTSISNVLGIPTIVTGVITTIFALGAIISYIGWVRQ